MIEQILEGLRANIEALPFIDRFGGLVRPQSKAFGLNPNTQRPIIKTFPIGCGVSALDCWENGRFADLVPNDNKLSVSYFEAPNRLNISEYTRGKRSVANWETVVKLVVWLNSPALGYNECGISAIPIMNLTNAINGRYNGVIIPEDSAYFQVAGEEVKSPDIFKAYSYDEQKKFLFWPYDYFCLNINVKYAVPSACAPELPILSPVTCVDDQ